MIADTAKQLAEEIRNSEEYRRLSQARSALAEEPAMLALLARYREMRLNAQAAVLTGGNDELAVKRMEQLGALLYDDPRSAELLNAEFAMDKLLADICCLLTEAAGTDLGGLIG